MSKKQTQAPENPDIMGIAMLDFIQQHPWENIRTWTSVGGADVLSLPYLFRTYEEMPAIEQKALQLSRGRVLDVGCGAGSHALWLQEKQLRVKAIDISEGAIATCRMRGLREARVQDVWDLKDETYDTILLLMNGIGVCSKLDTLKLLLQHLKTLLNPGGQILTDSSDLIYMYDTEEDPETEADPEMDSDNQLLLPTDHYYGEVIFKTFYKGLESDYFPWLYVDFFNLSLHALEAGLKCELVLEGEHFDYLARLTVK